MKKIITITALLLTGHVWSQIRDFQTTRLNSTAGAGVASVLSTEAAILNPASAAFFDTGSASAQSYKASLKNENHQRKTLPDHYDRGRGSNGYFVSDNSGPIKGGASYIQQNENGYNRDRLILHGAAPMGSDASVGVSYNYIQDRLPRKKYNDHFRVHHQIRLGTTYIISEGLSFGMVVVDPTRTNPGDERFLAGVQYQIIENLLFIGDVGTQYSKNVQTKNLWSAALQANIYGDFFIRGGKFADNVTGFRGTGWGASWVGPRFGIEFAQKFSDSFGPNKYLYKNERLNDTSLSAIIKF
jgi:hypothetical protein